MSLQLLARVASLLDGAAEDGAAVGTFTPESVWVQGAHGHARAGAARRSAYPAYVAPEQRTPGAGAGPRAGQFGLAVLAAALARRRSPRDARPRSAVRRVLRAGGQRRPGAPLPVGRIFVAALALGYRRPWPAARAAGGADRAAPRPALAAGARRVGPVPDAPDSEPTPSRDSCPTPQSRRLSRGTCPGSTPPPPRPPGGPLDASRGARRARVG
jgi:hypothetical protein